MKAFKAANPWHHWVFNSKSPRRPLRGQLGSWFKIWRIPRRPCGVRLGETKDGLLVAVLVGHVFGSFFFKWFGERMLFFDVKVGLPIPATPNHLLILRMEFGTYQKTAPSPKSQKLFQANDGGWNQITTFRMVGQRVTGKWHMSFTSQICICLGLCSS